MTTKRNPKKPMRAWGGFHKNGRLAISASFPYHDMPAVYRRKCDALADYWDSVRPVEIREVKK